MPDSKLRKYPIPLTEKILSYVKDKCQYGYDRLDSLLVIQSPSVNITARISITENPSNSKILVENFTSSLTLQLYTAIPKDSNIETDFCLGKIDEETFAWNCVQRGPINVVEDRFVYVINEPGSYAVLFSPLIVPEEEIWTSVYTPWFAEHPKLIALYVVLIFFLLVFIGLSLWCVSIQMKAYETTEKELKKYQQMLQENTEGGITEGNLLKTQEESGDTGDKNEELTRRLTQLEKENAQLKAKTTLKKEGEIGRASCRERVYVLV